MSWIRNRLLKWLLPDELRMEYGPGDRIILSSPKPISQTEAKSAIDAVARAFGTDPGHVLILSGGMLLKVVRSRWTMFGGKEQHT